MTVYNKNTFEIGKIRVNRVITIKQLIAKIASHYQIDQVQDLTIRLGDLDLNFNMQTNEKELGKRLFSDYNFTEANLIGVQISGESQVQIIQRKEEKMAA